MPTGWGWTPQPPRRLRPPTVRAMARPERIGRVRRVSMSRPCSKKAGPAEYRTGLGQKKCVGLRLLRLGAVRGGGGGGRHRGLLVGAQGIAVRGLRAGSRLGGLSGGLGRWGGALHRIVVVATAALTGGEGGGGGQRRGADTCQKCCAEHRF